MEDLDEEDQLAMIKEASGRHGVRAKLKGDEIYNEDLKQPPRFLMKMESYPKVNKISKIGVLIKKMNFIPNAYRTHQTLRVRSSTIEACFPNFWPPTQICKISMASDPPRLKY